MLPKQKRLTKREFNEVFQKTQSVRGPFFVVRFQKGSKKQKFAITISKKVIPKAVDRNHTKRLFFNALKIIEDTIPPELILIFIITQPTKNITTESLSREIAKVIKTIKP